MLSERKILYFSRHFLMKAHEPKRLIRRGDRVAEGARLESVCTPKAYRGFESLSLRQVDNKNESIKLN